MLKTTSKTSRKRNRESRKRKADYETLLARSENGVIETTYENIGIVLRYLNTQNWGGWKLPKMTIGYACHQYDCDGKIATTMKLDEAIEVYDGEKESMFQTGAPHGHLQKYCRC